MAHMLDPCRTIERPTVARNDGVIALVTSSWGSTRAMDSDLDHSPLATSRAAIALGSPFTVPLALDRSAAIRASVYTPLRFSGSCHGQRIIGSPPPAESSMDSAGPCSRNV